MGWTDDAHPMTFREALIRSYVEEGLDREDATAHVDSMLPPPPDESTLQGLLRAKFLEVEADLVIYGQHPPPPEHERPVLQGIGVLDEVIDWSPDLVSMRPPSTGDLEPIVHDPLWSLDRPRS